MIDIGGPYKVLEPGEHLATLSQIEVTFATNEHREWLFEGFKRGVKVFRKAGCKKIYLDGSFVTDKDKPGDYDACWDPTSVDLKKIDPVLLIFDNNRHAQKAKYFGEFFPSTALADGTNIFRYYFQNDKYTGKAKGIIRLEL